MPSISMFYGIVITIYFYDNKQHNLPHIHVRYQGTKAIFNIETSEMMEGNLPNKQKKLVSAWGWKYITKNLLLIGSLLLLATNHIKLIR